MKPAGTYNISHVRAPVVARRGRRRRQRHSSHPPPPVHLLLHSPRSSHVAHAQLRSMPSPPTHE
eukprot:2393134-Pyramimonas_sp.AAC.1